MTSVSDQEATTLPNVSADAHHSLLHRFYNLIVVIDNSTLALTRACMIQIMYTFNIIAKLEAVLFYLKVCCFRLSC